MTMYSDINLGLSSIGVNPATTIVIYDVQAIIQNVTTFVNTEQNEIWNFRAYGLNLKQFMQLPLTESTARAMESYITNQVTSFFPMLTYVDSASVITIDYNDQKIVFNFAYQINAIGQIITTPLIYYAYNNVS